MRPKSYETILLAHRRHDYELLATIHINDDRLGAIAEAKVITGVATYTDGSGSDGKIGAAAVLMVDKMELWTLQYWLGESHLPYRCAKRRARAQAEGGRRSVKGLS